MTQFETFDALRRMYPDLADSDDDVIVPPRVCLAEDLLLASRGDSLARQRVEAATLIETDNLSLAKCAMCDVELAFSEYDPGEVEIHESAERIEDECSTYERSILEIVKYI